jgi:hypothetical protein
LNRSIKQSKLQRTPTRPSSPIYKLRERSLLSTKTIRYGWTDTTNSAKTSRLKQSPSNSTGTM